MHTINNVKEVEKVFAEEISGKDITKKPKILVVDDEPHIAKLIKLSLKKKFDVIEAYNGQTAIEKVNQEKPDLVLLDLMMPGMNGLDVCKKLKHSKTTREIPIVILSAKSQLDDKFQGIDAGAIDYITKPFDPVDLLKKVEANLSFSGSKKEKAGVMFSGEGDPLKIFLQ